MYCQDAVGVRKNMTFCCSPNCYRFLHSYYKTRGIRTVDSRLQTLNVFYMYVLILRGKLCLIERPCYVY